MERAKLVVKASIKSGEKRGGSGCLIEFRSDEIIMLGNLFKMMYQEKDHYFKTIEVEADLGSGVKVVAKETGYYHRLFDNDKKFDIRSIIGKEVEIVTDSAEISKVEKDASLC